MQQQIPSTPGVTSPTPLEKNGADYFEQSTGSATRRSTRLASKRADRERGDNPSDSDDESRSPRSPTRNENVPPRRRTTNKPSTIPNRTTTLSSKASTSITNGTTTPTTRSTNGHLTAPSTNTSKPSRSPSPLGLIPIHTSFRRFIHRHEIPRKALHVSIGFLTLTLYSRGLQTSQIHPTLLTLLIPITTVEILRHRFPAVNRFYIRCLGALMRESEAHDRYNGVIWYLLGAWGALRFFPKDVGVMAVVLLSWCDTAASTFGRAYGRYTPAVRRGKSLAGSAAAAIVGVGAAALFWGVVAPHFAANGVQVSEGVDAFAFSGRLGLPGPVRGLVGWNGEREGTIGGWAAVGIVSVWSGLVAAGAEAWDLWGWDDNVTIPLLCGVGLWGFLGVFGA